MKPDITPPVVVKPTKQFAWCSGHVRRGTQLKSKLNDDLVREIRGWRDLKTQGVQCWSNTWLADAFAAELRVNRSTILNVLLNASWKHVTG